MTDGLKDVHREAIIATIAANDRVERAVLFGSRATGTNTMSSDVDIALFGDQLTLTDQARLAAALGEIPMAQSVDLLLYASVANRTLREHIRRQGIEWYARPRARRNNDATVPLVSTDDTGRSSLGAEGWLYRPTFPAHWTRRPLYSMARWVNGLAFRNIEFCNIGKPVIKIAEIKGGISDQTRFTRQVFDESVRVRSGDLLFSWSGQPETSIDAFWWRGPEGWLNQHVFRVTSAEGIDSTFLFYLLRYLKPNFVAIAGNKQTTGLGHVTKRDLERLVAAAPSQSEQRTIAQILGTLDDKIELNRRMNATLEAMARALFRSWFVDFDPVRAKMEGRAAGLPKEIADLFPDRLVDSEIGEIPDGWDVSTIGQEVDVVGGSTPSTKEPSFWNGSINWATPRDLSALASPVLVATSRRITERGLERISSGLLPRGTVLLSSRAPIGYLAIADVPVAINQGFIAMKCGRRLFAVYAWLWAAAHMDEILEKANGSTFLEISKRSFRPLPVVVPSEAVRVVHARFTQSLYDRIVKNERESGVLASVRDVLLPKLVSGKLRVNVRDQAQPADERSIATAGASA